MVQVEENGGKFFSSTRTMQIFTKKAINLNYAPFHVLAKLLMEHFSVGVLQKRGSKYAYTNV